MSVCACIGIGMRKTSERSKEKECAPFQGISLTYNQAVLFNTNTQTSMHTLARSFALYESHTLIESVLSKDIITWWNLTHIHRESVCIRRKKMQKYSMLLGKHELAHFHWCAISIWISRNFNVIWCLIVKSMKSNSFGNCFFFDFFFVLKN